MRFLPLLLACLGAVRAGTPANWTGNYSPCNRHSALLAQGHLDLGVRVSTANPVLAKQFRRAMDFWASILDLSWHEDDSENCALQVIDGEKSLFQPEAIAARSQLPDRSNFQGWIAFNPRSKLSETELYRVSIHEIGHLLGLPHSTRASSVMYGFELDDQDWLDTSDIEALSARHTVRGERVGHPIRLSLNPYSSQQLGKEGQGNSPDGYAESRRFSLRPAADH